MVGRVKWYLYNLLLAIDQLVNAILGGYCDETISSRIGKRVVRNDSWLCNLLCKLLNLIEKDHCIKAIEKDEGDAM